MCTLDELNAEHEFCVCVTILGRMSLHLHFQYCSGRHHVVRDAVCFIVKAKALCLAFQMSTRLEISGYVIFYNTVPEQYNANIRVRAAHFMKDCFLNPGESSLQCEQCEWLVLLNHVSTFQNFKNLLLTIQTQVLSSLE